MIKIFCLVMGETSPGARQLFCRTPHQETDNSQQLPSIIDPRDSNWDKKANNTPFKSLKLCFQDRKEVIYNISANMSTAPTTQPFGWALPSSEQNKLKTKSDSPKPIANPLLKASPHHDTIGVQSPLQMRFPFSPVNNTTMRRRKPPTVSFQADRPVFLPPKASLPVDGAFLEIPETTVRSKIVCNCVTLTLLLTKYFYG